MPVHDPSDTALIIPTLNAGPHLSKLLPALKSQTFTPGHFLVIDSSSDDHTVAEFRALGARVHIIDRAEFDHGGTRQLGVDMVPEAEIVVFLTQDAILADPEAIARLVAAFDDAEVGVAYGRQLPHSDATAIAAHARLFNYPGESHECTKKDIPELGLRAAFCSNSIAAYRRKALVEIGGFKMPTIFGEDMLAASQIILAGWKKAYVSSACVYHSHNYSIYDEFKRYFDIGVLHSREKFLLDAFGRVEGSGLKFIKSELHYLYYKCAGKIPSALLRTIIKYIAYRAGKIEARLPLFIRRWLSMNINFWR